MLVFLSVPIIATAVQEELETGSASSGDAACATNTVKHSKYVQQNNMLYLGKFESMNLVICYIVFLVFCEIFLPSGHITPVIPE